MPRDFFFFKKKNTSIAADPLQWAMVMVEGIVIDMLCGSVNGQYGNVGSLSIKDKVCHPLLKLQTYSPIRRPSRWTRLCRFQPCYMLFSNK